MNDQMRPLLTRGGLALGLFVLGIIAGWMLHGLPSWAKTSRALGFDDWRLICPADTEQKSACAMVGSVTESNQRVGQVSFVLKDGDPSKRMMIVQMPLGVLLSSGFKMQIGSDTQVFPYSVCDEGGCAVTADVDEKLLDEIAQAPSVGVVVSDAQGRTGTLSLSTKGFNDARAVMNSTEARRRSWWRRLWS